MQLVTTRFGCVDFEPAELLVFEEGLLSYPKDRQWLLLADSRHESLYWLQSISNSSVAVPVVDLVDPTLLTVDVETSRILRLRTDNDLSTMMPIHVADDEITVDSHLPILINAKYGRCRQLRNERHQSHQRTMALLSAGLRQSA